MDPLAGNVTQCGNDHSLTLKPRLTGEGGTFNLYREMRFAAAIIAAVAVMARGIVDNGEAGGREGGAQQRFDFLCKWTGHTFPSSASVAMGKSNAT